jgi:transcription initiation factor IIE alpha subunit
MILTDEEYKNALFVIKEYEAYHRFDQQQHTWQVCPKCNGLSDKTHLQRCKVCSGEKIISKLNGKPPSKA